MTNYEQRLIADLRRSQGKAMGKIEARLDRANIRIESLREMIKTLAIRLNKAESLVVAAFLDRDGPPPPPPKD